MVKTGTYGPYAVQAGEDMIPELCGLILKTIRETCAKYYPEEAVRFFLKLYGEEKRLEREYVRSQSRRKNRGCRSD